MLLLQLHSVLRLYLRFTTVRHQPQPPPPYYSALLTQIAQLVLSVALTTAVGTAVLV